MKVENFYLPFILRYSEARKKKYTSKQLERLEYISNGLLRYPMLQSFDFT